MPPLVFEPYYRPQPWGGRRFVDLGRDLPSADLYGECWDLSAHRHHISRVAEGPWAGSLLTDLWREHAVEWTGSEAAADADFPLLIKLLDCEQPLSVQVHPDDALASRVGPQESGKAEAWVVMDVAPAGRIHAGLKPGVTPDALRKHLNAGTVVDCLHSFVPQPGDCILVQPGTVHAIANGVLLVEVQQTSDITWRLFDWNRVGLDGRPRELHVEEALTAIDWSMGPVNPLRRRSRALNQSSPCSERLVDCEYFNLERFGSRAAFELPWSDQLSVWTVLAGSVCLKQRGTGYQRCFQRGETVLIPATSDVTIWEPQGEAELLGVTVPSLKSTSREHTPVACELKG